MGGLRGMLTDPLLSVVREYLPADLLAECGLPGLTDALRMVHRPGSIAEAERGRDRLAYEELLFVQLLQRRANRIAREARKGIQFENRRELTTALREALPFQLTHGQKKAIGEIVSDMCSERKMHRLLQGDVGSGKTIVALFACMLAMENGFQAAIMAPTELLAEQHFASISRFVLSLGIEPVLVTGGMQARDRAEAARDAAARRE